MPKQLLRTFKSSFLGLVVLNLGVLEPAFAEPKLSGVVDQLASTEVDPFQSETVVVNDEILLEGVEPLPVEFVEEQLVTTATVTIPAIGSEEDPLDAFFEEDGIDSSLGQVSAASTQANDRGEIMSTALDVRDAEIPALVKAMSKITGRNYVLDSKVKGKITIHLPTPVSESEALNIFDAVLLHQGFTTVPIGNNVWKIVSSKDAKQTTIPLFDEEVDQRSDSLVTELVRLKHVTAEDMQQLISQFVGGSGGINAYSGTNTLLIIDSAANIGRLKRIINELDVPANDQDITIIPIIHADAEDIAEKIKEILGEDDKQQASATTRSSSRGRSSRRSRRSPSTPTTQNVQARALPLKIIPDKRTNSIIVVADPENTARVQVLIEKLDSELDLSGGRFYVYRLQHADAEELVEILNEVISGESGEEEESSGRRSSRRQRTARAIVEALKERGRVRFEGQVTIASDPSTNSLIINASNQDYLRVRQVIEALDIRRRQVLVEATIVEVRLTKEEGMGVELQASAGNDEGGVLGQTNFGGLSNLISNPAQLSDLTIAAASTGTLTLPGGLVIPSQAILVSALSRNSNVNVLSSPTIIATDNEEAEIIVGENVPFVTSTSTDPSNLSNTFNQIERQDVGITLRIKPQVSSGDFVSLQIFIEISNVVAGTRNDPNGPTTTIRTQETSVEVKNGQMVITGGLMSDNVTESTRGVPFFQDIPVIGQYFKRQDTNVNRTNLLVFITPKIISTKFDARDETKEYSGKLEDVIELQDASPNRREVLRSPDMDQVVEQYTGELPLPTTITPVEPIMGSRARSGASTGFNVTGDVESLDGGGPLEIKALDDDVLDIVVSPQLPDLPAAKSDKPKKTKAKKVKPVAKEVKKTREEPEKVAAKSDAEALGVPSPQTGVVEVAVATPVKYVVLRNMNGGDFNTNKPVNSLGLVVSGGPSGYFGVGRRYRRIAGPTGGETFVVLGSYDSRAQAAESHPGLAQEDDWHTLSPGEILGLGQTHWIRE